MAYSVSSFTYGATNAALKAWVQRFIDLMSAGGWVQTSDTGQLVPASITADAPANDLSLGYCVFVLDDSNRATDPIYLRVDFTVFGIGYNAAGAIYRGPQALLTIGFATDGAGALTGNVVSCGRHSSGPGYEIMYKQALDVFASGDGWATIFHGIGFGYYDTAMNYRQICAVSVARMRTSDGDIVPGKVFVAYPEPNRDGQVGNAYSAYRSAGVNRDTGSLRMLGAYLPKDGTVIAGLAVCPGVIGSAAASGSVGGIVQAQPVWMFHPQIAPFPGLVVVPSTVFSVGQVFTASLDGVNEYQYVNLGAAGLGNSQGAMYAIDSFAGSTFCFAARVA